MDAEIARIPSKTDVPDLLLLAAAAGGLRLSVSAAMRRAAVEPHALYAWLLGLAAVGFAVLVFRQFARLWRRRESWALYLGAAFLCVLLYRLGNRRPEIAPVELPLALLTPDSGGVSGLVVRPADPAGELQQRIVLQALALAFVVEFAVAIAFALLESVDVPRPPSVTWAALLVASWSAGLAIFSRRYA